MATGADHSTHADGHIALAAASPYLVACVGVREANILHNPITSAHNCHGPYTTNSNYQRNMEDRDEKGSGGVEDGESSERTDDDDGSKSTGYCGDTGVTPMRTG